MKVAATKEADEAERKLVKDLTGEILRAAKARGWKDHELAAAAKKKGLSTFYAWRNGSRKSPSVLDLQAFAQAVGLSVRLVSDSTGNYGDGVIVHHQTGATSLKPQSERLLRIMERGSEDLRNAIMEKVEDLLIERSSNPPEADEPSGPLARNK